MLPIGIGISAGDALKAIEMALKGFDWRNSSKRKMFEDHVGPCYDKLGIVHEDYLKALRKIISDYEATPQNVANLRAMWAGYSTMTAPARGFLKAYSFAWNAEPPARSPPEVNEFFLQVSRYFDVLASPVPTDERCMRAHSMFQTIRRVLESENKIVKHFDRVSECLELVLNDRWKAVSVAFARARMALLR